MDIDKSISEALGIEPTNKVEIIPPEKAEANVPASVSQDSKSMEEEDFEFVRNKLKSLIEKGTLKLDEMGTLATELENARAFEVYGSLIEKVSDLSKDLYELHKKKKETQEISNEGSSSVNIEKAVFVGNQTELLDAIKKKKNGEQI